MTHSRSHLVAVSFTIMMVWFCSTKPAAAQTRSWVGAGHASLNWHGPLNWSPVGIPLPGDSVFIGDLVGQENDWVIVSDMDAEVTNLTLLESTELSHNSITLTVSDTMTLSDTSLYDLTANLVAGNVTLTDSAVFEMNGTCQVEVEGEFTIGSNAVLAVDGGQIVLSNLAASSGALLINNGTILGTGWVEPLTIQASGAGKIDLDGTTGNGQIDLNFSAPMTGSDTLRILSPLNDSFSGELRIGDGSTLEITNAWTADEFARIDFFGGRISGGPFTSAADIFVTGPSSQETASRISSNAVINGGTMDVALDGALTFESSASFSGSATVNSNGTIGFNGSTIINGVNFTGNGTLIINSGLTIQGDVTLEATTFNWDGTGSLVGKSTTINSGASLSIDAITVDSSDDLYEGLLTMNGGTLSVNNLADEWTHAGTAVISGNNTISGDRMVVNGDFNVSSGAQNVQAQIDFGVAADVDIFGAGTSVTTQASSRFLPGTEVTVGAGSTLNLNGTVTWDGPALVNGEGTIVQNGSSVVLGHTIIDVVNFDWDGTGETSTTNISEASSYLTINSTSIDADNHFNGNLLITGVNTGVSVNTATPWHMDGYLRLDQNGGLGGTAPVTIAGQIDVEGTGTYIASAATFAAAAQVSLEQDSWFGLFGLASSIDGADFSGPGTLAFYGATTISTGSTIDVDTIEILFDPLTMTGGQVTTANLTKEATAPFNLQGGNFTVSGGDAAFNSTFIFGGVGDPIVSIEEGADAVVTFAWRMAPATGDSGTTFVTGTGGGRRSTLRGTGGGAGADLVVGLSGNASLVVSQGGLASFRDDFIIGQNAGSVGEATVVGVQDSFRATVDVTGSAGNSSVQIGGGDGGGAAAGILRIQAGAFVDVSGDVIMARYPGVDSVAHLEIGGIAGGFPAELNVADDIFVGGTTTTAGGDATITFDSGGLLRGDEMIVWGNSTVDMNGGDMFLNTLNLTNGGDFNLAGGVLHVGLVEGSLTNIGGTISPGGSPGATAITGDYKHDPGASLLIELAGLAAGTEHDVFEVVNDAILNGGTLDVVLDGGFTPRDGDRFDILNFGSIQRAFDTVNLPSLPNTLAWDASQLYSTGVLAVMTALTADFDEDGDVDGDDLRVWQKFYSVTDDADADGDGDSDGRDFLEWQRQYTGPLPVSSFETHTVPEPCCPILAGIVAIVCVVRRGSLGQAMR